MRKIDCFIKQHLKYHAIRKKHGVNCKFISISSHKNCFIGQHLFYLM